AAEHDKEAIMEIAKEIGRIYAVGKWAHEDEATALRAMASAGENDLAVDIRTTHGINERTRTD
ncbi:MAG: hypothetical protein PHH09_03060, partial [Methanoregulaceae archaeon]|nr:hypothetical protein [Methanoregulaceae archaeon]